jgi:hypothetical protein
MMQGCKPTLAVRDDPWHASQKEVYDFSYRRRNAETHLKQDNDMLHSLTMYRFSCHVLLFAAWLANMEAQRVYQDK